MAPNAMPVSQATNAYELLDEIATLITEEPRRYNQTFWKLNPTKVREELLPACQTVCCVAGWVDELKSPQPVRSFNYFEMLPVSDAARHILGLSQPQADELFSEFAAGPRSTTVTDVLCAGAHSGRGSRAGVVQTDRQP